MSAVNSAMPKVAVIGAGPAGLMAAEVLSHGGVRVDVYDAMPSPGRKFLLAGVGGMNLTHAEAREQFLSRYGVRADHVADWLDRFGRRFEGSWRSQPAQWRAFDVIDQPAIRVAAEVSGNRGRSGTAFLPENPPA